jgi:tripartite-type tricarboxylate transporter receptor subunit TctC
MELLKPRAGVAATHVPYKGSAVAATVALLSGEVAMTFVNVPAAIPHVRSGRLRAIAVAEKKRIAAAPDIPTLDESGLPGFEATPWLGLGARAGTSQDVIARLNETAVRALARPDAVNRMSGLGIETRAMTPGEFAEFIRAETKKWGEIIRRSGAKAE